MPALAARHRHPPVATRAWPDSHRATLITSALQLDAIRVAALANNAPVSFGALGAPIIALAAVTKLPLDALSASVGRIVAILAPFIILIAVVVAATGPWSHLSSYNFVKPAITAISSLSHKQTDVNWAFALRTQGGRRDQAQPGLDPGHARLPHSHRAVLPRSPPRRDAPVALIATP
jgi:hypothetical protein